jgi:hypothetical protein
MLHIQLSAPAPELHFPCDTPSLSFCNSFHRCAPLARVRSLIPFPAMVARHF